MKIIESIKKQEAHSKITLTDAERELVSAFFEEREREANALDTVNPHKNTEENGTDVQKNRLREDVSSADTDRNTVLALSPDTDGAFVCVPRTL